MATIKDVSKKTGLSLATISKYINGGNLLENNRVAIENAINELGYTVNQFGRSLKTSRSMTIGVVIPELSSLFVTSIITVVEDVLRHQGYGIIICDCRTDAKREAEAIEFLLQKRVDGIINMPSSKDGKSLELAIKNEIPVVLIDRLISELKGKVNAVLVDNISASTIATRELLNAGHENIGVLLGPQHTFTSQQRLLGYHQELIKNMLTPDNRLTLYSDYTVQGGYENMKKLLKQSELTAVFATNYELTLGAIIALNEAEVQMPEKLSIIGFDNLELAKVIKPKLTIITQPIEKIGEATAKILLENLEKKEGKMAPQIITLSTGITRGNSIHRIK